MPRPKLDKETNKLLSEQEQIKKLTEHEGWEIAKRKLIEYVAGLSNLATINNTDPNKVFLDVSSRQLAGGLLLKWMQEIEGTAAQFDANKELTDQIKGSYIVHFDMNQ